jgi:UDP-N-acetylmuramoylalanine-D-glutamate ligase
MAEAITLDTLKNGDFNFGIVGLGVENKKFLTWLVKTANIDPKRIYLSDKKQPDIEFDEDLFGGTFFGENNLDICKSNISHIFKTPGMWSLLPEFDEFRQKHGSRSIHSSLVIFFHHHRDTIIGVTGTKGKTTTASLIKYLIGKEEFIKEYEVIHNSKPEAIYTGNTTNTSPYEYWTDLDKSIDPHLYYVLELSSFQLQDLGYDELSPKRSAITNYYIDHQDQHQSIEEYWNAKNNIHLFQDQHDYFIASDQIKGKTLTNKFKQNTMWVDNDLSESLLADITAQIIGSHNRTNMSLSLLTCITVLNEHIQPSELSTTAQSLLNTYPTIFEDFQGLKHRLEVISQHKAMITLTIGGKEKNVPLIITGVNDSQSTMPDATRAGLLALTEKPEDSVWLIISGIDKGGSVNELSDTILDTETNHQLFRINYYGEIGQHVLSTIYQRMGVQSEVQPLRIKEELPNQLDPISKVISEFQSWVQDKINESESINDTRYIENIDEIEEFHLNIVLSPCGSSFDEFKNAYERGDWFSDLIKKSFDN